MSSSATTSAPTHLVVVCCHGIWTGGPTQGTNEAEWLIADFQAGETPTFIEHIKVGLGCLRDDPLSELVFSGGPTRKETRLSEAQSYANLAVANGFFGIFDVEEAKGRIFLDEQALDSYHNVIFPLVHFWRRHGGTQSSWPQRLTLVSHAFKKVRIVGGHCAAIGFPLDRVQYLGVDPPSMIAGADGGGGVANKGAMAGALAAVHQWSEDPHGTGELLAGKRAKRNPWGVDQKFFFSDEERYRSGLPTLSRGDGGDETLVDGKRPWS